MRENHLLILTLSFVAAFFAVLSLAFIIPSSKVLSASTNQNRIVSLYDAFGSSNTEPSVSCGSSTLIEYNDKRILFDVGSNADRFKKNVQALGLDLKTIDFAVLSHPYTNHLGSFGYLASVNPNVKLYLPGDAHIFGSSRVFPFGDSEPTTATRVPPEKGYLGTRVNKTALTPSGRFYSAKNIQYLNKDLEVAPGITLIATKSPYLGTFNAYPPNSSEKPALTSLSELSLALKTSQGEVVIAGCSHTGIEKIVETTQASVGRKVDTVVIGFKIFRQVFGKEYKFGQLGSQITFPT